jgi:hypothetical protein
MRNIVCLILPSALLFSCKEKFSEYPPSNILTVNQQVHILNSFLVPRYSIADTSEEENMKDLHRTHKLEYFREVNGRSFFLISWRTDFLSDGSIYYGGEVKVSNGDTALIESFEAEIYSHLTRDSVKVLFDKMVSDSTQRRF